MNNTAFEAVLLIDSFGMKENVWKKTEESS